MATLFEEGCNKSKFQEKRKRKAVETNPSSKGSKRKQREIVVVENNSGEVEFILGEVVNSTEDSMSNDNDSQHDNRLPDEEDVEEILNAFEEENLMDSDADENE